ncbi:MAG TPA: VWA domain-containing protein [Thermoanaerobaculia bacterium]|nr:VWA domain-containing protein [Thermoanaerobaculia bacterium]
MLVFSLSPTLASAQDPKLVESIEVRITNVDVIVTDRSGKPVTGLTKDDFTIYENKRQQPITNFYEMRAQPENAGPAAATTSESANPPVAEPLSDSRQRRFLLFVDNYSIHPHDRNRVLEALEKFVGTHMQPGDSATLVSWNRALKVDVPMTRDKDVIRRGVSAMKAAVSGGPSMIVAKEQLKSRCNDLFDQAKARRIPMGMAYGQSLSMIRSYADELVAVEKGTIESMRLVLAGMAGLEGKKVMVFTGAHLPERPGIDLFQWLDMTYAQYMRNQAPAMLSEGSERSQVLKLEALARKANAEGVAIYTIDTASAEGGAIAADSREAGDVSEQFADFTNTAMALQALARVTGGMALSATRNFDVAFETVASDLSSYYSLGYRSDARTGSERAIAVKTRNPAYRVRSRQTYVAKSNEDEMNDRVIANVYGSGIHGEVPVSMEVGSPVRDNDEYLVPLKIHFDSKLTLIPDGADLAGGFNVLVVVGSSAGALSKVSRIPQPVRIPKEKEAWFRANPILFNVSIKMRPGENLLSVGVVDQISNSSGFTRASVVVP